MQVSGVQVILNETLLIQEVLTGPCFSLHQTLLDKDQDGKNVWKNVCNVLFFVWDTAIVMRLRHETYKQEKQEETRWKWSHRNVFIFIKLTQKLGCCSCQGLFE